MSRYIAALIVALSIVLGSSAVAVDPDTALTADEIQALEASVNELEKAVRCG
ncbi:MAG: hypothetical protein R3F37_13665 [Candidatus Competibacteraceae bacterium]